MPRDIFFPYCLYFEFLFFMFFFFKQKTAYEMRISDWGSDVCSSDLSGADSADCAASRTFIVSRPVRTPAFEEGETMPFDPSKPDLKEIGRASCRERVCQYV